MKEKVNKKSSSNRKRWVKAAGVVGAIVLPVAVGVYLFNTLPMLSNYRTIKPIGAVSGATSTSSSQGNMSAPSTAIGSVKTFTSNTLGISFDYVSSIGNVKVLIKEDDSSKKIYVYPENSFGSAQYVEVMSKDPSDSILNAINKNILNGYSPSECQASIAGRSSNPQLVNDPASYTFAVLHFPSDKRQGLIGDSMHFGPGRCPDAYTGVESTAYFFMDTNHPDKLLYLSLGQYNTPGSAENSSVNWQDTIKFL